MEITTQDKMLAVYWDMPADFQINTSRNTLGFGFFDSGNVDNSFEDFAGGKGADICICNNAFLS